MFGGDLGEGGVSAPRGGGDTRGATRPKTTQPPQTVPTPPPTLPAKTAPQTAPDERVRVVRDRGARVHHPKLEVGLLEGAQRRDERRAALDAVDGVGGDPFRRFESVGWLVGALVA
jgi:hypothetical protein